VVTDRHIIAVNDKGTVFTHMVGKTPQDENTSSETHACLRFPHLSAKPTHQGSLSDNACHQEDTGRFVSPHISQHRPLDTPLSELI